MDFAQIILSPFVWLLTFFYNFFGSYGIALILFAVVVKLILFPFALKGKRSMIQMNMLQGKMQKLQKQYGRDRERYNLEVQKLYEREKVNPMGGCLWSFLPLLILIPLYAIIRQPIKYMMGINDVEILNQIAQVVDWNSIAVSNGWIKEAGEAFSNVGYNQLYLSSLITPENLEAVKAAVGEVGSRIFAVNFDFLGLVDLARIPTLKFWTVAGGFALFLLPVVSAGSSLVFSFISMKTNAVNQQAAQAGNNASMKSMMIISPLISLWIGLSVLDCPDPAEHGAGVHLRQAAQKGLREGRRRPGRAGAPGEGGGEGGAPPQGRGARPPDRGGQAQQGQEKEDREEARRGRGQDPRLRQGAQPRGPAPVPADGPTTPTATARRVPPPTPERPPSSRPDLTPAR